MYIYIYVSIYIYIYIYICTHTHTHKISDTVEVPIPNFSVVSGLILVLIQQPVFNLFWYFNESSIRLHFAWGR